MINLLANDKKAAIQAARTNVILVRYIVILLFAIVFILGAMYVTYTVLGVTKKSSDEIIASNDLKTDAYSATKAQVDALSNSLSQTKVILNGEVRYSKVLVNIAQQMPAGTVFGNLSLDSNSLGGTPVTATAYAKTSADALALSQNFEKSPIFTGVSFRPIVETGGGIDGYPVSIDLTFTLTKAATQ